MAEETKTIFIFMFLLGVGVIHCSNIKHIKRDNNLTTKSYVDLSYQCSFGKDRVKV